MKALGDPDHESCTEALAGALSLHNERVIERDESDACIRDLLIAFERELAAGYTTYEQQAVLCRAKRVIAAHGNADPPKEQP